jgi:hypothetical protein
MALTNVPAVSRLLWSEFLDDNTPTWFTALPTDIQAYLSGEFGPTTAASNSASSTRSSSSSSISSTPSPSPTNSAAAAAADPSNHHDGGLPLWAKIVIGVVVPLFVLILLGLLLCCCLRRRRHRKHANARSRTPTPAFISSTHRGGRANPPGEQHLPLRGGYIGTVSRGISTYIKPGTNHQAIPSQDAEAASDSYSPSNPHTSTTGSDDYRTPLGGPSYENIPPPAVATNAHSLRRSSRHSSRHSSTSLHSVPEMPEPMHGGAAAVPLPPRSSQRNREFGSGNFGGGHTPAPAPVDGHEQYVSGLVSPMQSSYGGDGVNDGPYHNQGIYAGGHNPYPNAQHHHHQGSANGGYRPYSDPFSDPTSPRHSAYDRTSNGSGVTARDPELFMNHNQNQHVGPQDDGANWPLRASEEREGRSAGRTKSYDRYYERAPVYEM